MRDIAELVSLWMTIPYICLACIVMRDFFPHFKQLLNKHRRSLAWFGSGVFVGFFGGGIDNAYWFAAWGSEYIEHPSTVWLFRNGVFSNIPFRQFCGVVSAYLHIRGLFKGIEEISGQSTAGKIKNLHGQIIASCLFATIVVAVLVWIKH